MDDRKNLKISDSAHTKLKISAAKAKIPMNELIEVLSEYFFFKIKDLEEKEIKETIMRLNKECQ